MVPAILKKKPLIVILLGTDANIFPWRIRTNFLLARYVLNRADKIVAVSEEIKKTLVDRMNVDPLKIHVIHCSGVDTKLFKPVVGKGRMFAAVSEERVTNKKHYFGFPENSGPEAIRLSERRAEDRPRRFWVLFTLMQ